MKGQKGIRAHSVEAATVLEESKENYGSEAIFPDLQKELKGSIQELTSLADQYEKTGEAYLFRARNIRQGLELILRANDVASEEKAVPEKNEEEKTEDENRIISETKKVCENLPKNSIFTSRDVLLLVKKSMRIRNQKSAMFSIRSVLSFLVKKKVIFSCRKGSRCIYAFSLQELENVKKGKEASSPRVIPDSMVLQTLCAMHELEKVGSKVTCRAVLHQLVNAHGKSYEKIEKRSIQNAIDYLKRKRGFVFVSQKSGNTTAYQLTQAARDFFAERIEKEKKA